MTVRIWHLRAAAAIALTSLPSVALAGGWTQEKGHVYGKITYGTSSANQVFRFDGTEKYPTDSPPFTVRDYPLADRSIFLYAEYGLLNELTLIGSGVLKRTIVTTPVERRETSGLGDLGLAAKYRLAEFDQQVVSATLGFTIPTGYTRDLTPPLGSGNLNVELAANYGISFYPAPAYATGSVGYRVRPSIYLSSLQNENAGFDPNYADEIFADAEAGYTFADRVLVHGMARFVTSTRIGTNDFDVTHPPETQQYLKLGGGAIFKVHSGIELSVDAMVTPMGKKATKSFDLMIGVAYSGDLLGSPSDAK